MNADNPNDFSPAFIGVFQGILGRIDPAFSAREKKPAEAGFGCL
jgi:hypothetical protein